MKTARLRQRAPLAGPETRSRPPARPSILGAPRTAVVAAVQANARSAAGLSRPAQVRPPVAGIASARAPEGPIAGLPEPRFGRDFSAVRARANTLTPVPASVPAPARVGRAAAAAGGPPPARPIIQARKVNLGGLSQPGDKLEQEAEQVAEAVTRGRRALPRPNPSGVRQQASAGLPAAAAITYPEAVAAGLRSPGQALDHATQALMEAQLGHAFGGVRVHTDAAAAASAQAVEAEAYTVGTDIVFGAGRFAPGTAAGQRLLAHELTHVVQQDGWGTATSPLMRSGRTFGGFLANIFRFWDYAKETLDAYLQWLDENNRIEGDDNSDDKARQIVRDWKNDQRQFNLTPKIRVLLVREMLDGYVGTDDQKGILDVLDGSTNPELKVMFQTLSYAEMESKFGSLKPRLALFKTSVLDRVDQFKDADSKGAKSAENVLDDFGAVYGADFTDIAVSFHVGPGNLYESFAANLTVPPEGATVTITLTRQALTITVNPSIVIDLVWPLSNAELNGFTLTFAGLKPKLDITGNDFAAAKAQGALETFLKGLTAGTRFAQPNYNPLQDPQLSNDLTHRDASADLSRLQYNFTKDLKGGGEAKAGLDSISDAAVYLNVIYKPGRPVPASGFDVVVPPGTGFGVQIYTTGKGSEVAKKNVQLEKVVIESTGIFVYEGPRKIVGLKRVEMGRGFKITFGELEPYVDVAAYAREQIKKRFGDTDTWYTQLANAATKLVPDDYLLELAGDVGAGYLRHVIRQLVDDNRARITGALGVTDAQLNAFLGSDED